MSGNVNKRIGIDTRDIYTPGESAVGKLSRKAAEDPFVPVGIAGFVVAVGYGAYAYRNRRGMSTSIYLMRLRVIAQTCVVGAMTLGVGYKMLASTFKKDNS
ncbi:HIG1 domain family member 1A, mitochondrial-like [Anneissia japonica]|uniref:HIG1 domain family member 1A, mitochondrial-like n=1 Tax=Anneissia japonica TaxID=1529436 RepID=UPI0014259B49|nr:HIG1 domain family member 1A, mitochondrial-like [Anneissia japonica]